MSLMRIVTWVLCLIGVMYYATYLFPDSWLGGKDRIFFGVVGMAIVLVIFVTISFLSETVEDEFLDGKGFIQKYMDKPKTVKPIKNENAVGDTIGQLSMSNPSELEGMLSRADIIEGGLSIDK